MDAFQYRCDKEPATMYRSDAVTLNQISSHFLNPLFDSSVICIGGSVQLQTARVQNRFVWATDGR